MPRRQGDHVAAVCVVIGKKRIAVRGRRSARRCAAAERILFGADMELILASASPRRKQILAETGARFRVVVSEGEERPDLSLPPEEIVKALARQKAENVFARYPGAAVLGADTIVYFEGEVLGKPESEEDAEKMLRRLSGKTHSVYTGYCILAGARRIEGACRTEVVFNDLSEQFIREYVAGGSPMDKAGAYGIQDDARLVKEYRGSYTNIVGLPREEIAAKLKEIGLLK